jgi:MoxR-like ATPase
MANISIVNKFQTVQSHMNNVVFERENEIELMLTAIIARQHVFLLGLPGVAKSYLIRSFLECMDDAKYFDKLFTAFTSFEEVFGPLSLQGLKQDKFEYKIDNFAADSHFMFADEVFKANSPILNSLLTLMEERQFTNGVNVLKAPLVSMFAASNELPRDESLKAMYDRFTVRLVIQPLFNSDSFIKMLTAQPVSAPKVLSLVDLEEANKLSKAVKVEGCLEEFANLRRQVQVDLADTVYVSDRRWKACLNFLKAYVWLNGRDQVTPDDFMALQNCLWEKPEQSMQIAGVLAEYVSPFVNEVQACYNEAAELMAEATKNRNNMDMLAGIFSRLKESKKKVEQIRSGVSDAHKPHVEKVAVKFDVAFDSVKKLYTAAMGL